jgi:RNA polymerase sigma factor (sigma-70 family)
MESQAIHNERRGIALGRKVVEQGQYSRVSNYLRIKFPRVPYDTIYEATHYGISKWYDSAPAHVHTCPVKTRGWIIQVAQRSLSREIRRERRFTELPTHDKTEERGVSMSMPDDLKRDDLSLILGTLSVEKLFSILTPTIAETMRLHVLDGYTASEVAALLGCSRDTVKKRLKKGYARLREAVRNDECTW